MTDADAFLDAIHANPADDLPRLVYADWLEEHGEGDYAAFIRLSCQIERREPSHPAERRNLREERHRLRQRMMARWTEQLPDFDPEQVVSSHGDPARVLTVQAPSFLSWDGCWPGYLPSRLLLLDFVGHERGIAGCPRLTGASHLEFAGFIDYRWLDGPPYPPVSDLMLRLLCESPNLASLRVVRFHDLFPSRNGLTEFASSAFVAGLMQFRFGFSTDLFNHHWRPFEAVQPPPGAISDMAHRFLDEHGDLIPEN